MLADKAAAAAPVLDRAAAASAAGDHAGALALLDAVLVAHRFAPALHTARGWALENLGDQRLCDARAAYEQALALDGTAPWALAGLANVFVRLGSLGSLGAKADHDAAAPLYGQAIAHARPRCTADPELIELIGWCQYKLGQLGDAAASFESALVIEADWPSVHFDLGLVRLLQGRGDDTAAHYRDGLACLAARGTHGALAERGTLLVAIHDFDDALAATTSPFAAAPALRALLAAAAAAAAADTASAEPSHV